MNACSSLVLRVKSKHNLSNYECEQQIAAMHGKYTLFWCCSMHFAQEVQKMSSDNSTFYDLGIYFLNKHKTSEFFRNVKLKIMSS